jgi:hypothetical protein
VRVVLVVALVAGAACARRPAPRDPTTAALFRDLERHVTIAGAAGWNVDRIEVDEVLDGALDSACRVEPLARRSLLSWLDDEIARLGGPVADAWRARGKKLSAVEDLLVVSRIRMVLARADEVAATDCPFWVEPEHPFRGRQISSRRWQLTLGGGGKGIVVQRGEQVDLSAGGAGRLLLGRTLTDGDAIYAGVEVGASASFPKDDTGERTALVIGVDFVAPLVYRYMLTNAYFEFEAGYLGQVTEQDWSDVAHGIHAGFAFGARALRTRFVFPGAAIGMSYERSLVPGDDVVILKVGARVTFDLDL